MSTVTAANAANAVTAANSVTTPFTYGMPALDFNAICKGSTRKERRSQRRRDYFAHKAWLKTFEYKTLILGVNKLSDYVEKLELAQQYHKFILDGIGAHDAASTQILFANLQIYEYIKCELFKMYNDLIAIKKVLYMYVLHNPKLTYDQLHQLNSFLNIYLKPIIIN